MGVGTGVVKKDRGSARCLNHQPPPPPPPLLLQAVVGLIRNLELCQENQVPLREAGAVPRLVNLLLDSHKDAQKHVSSNKQNYQVCFCFLRESLRGFFLFEA